MLLKATKLAAPFLGALLVVSTGLAATASASPYKAARQIQAEQTQKPVQIDHRRGHDRQRHDQQSFERRGHDRRGGQGWHEGRGRGHHALGPRQIRRSLRHRGFHRIHILDRRGPMYVVRANGWRGVPMRLLVDSRTAHIVRSRPVGHGFHRQFRW